MREVTGITIDDVSTRDIDDAIWVEKTAEAWTAWVSISDVSKYVPLGGPEDVGAKEMVATKYFARGNSPMLPLRLSEDELSLWPHKPKRAMTVEVKLPLDLGEPTFSIYRSRLISQAKLSYGMIPESLTPEFQPADERTAKLAGVVKLAAELAMGLLEQRRKNGAFAFYDLNNGWITTEEGFLRQIEDHRDAMGQIIVQEMMILANVCVAKWAVQNEIPVPLRNHTARMAAPDRADLMKQLNDALRTPMANLDLVRQRVHMLLDKAEYGVALQGHYGLNVPCYLHFTSPIRRYADLVTHRQVRAALKGEPLPYTRDQIDWECQYINETLRAEAEEVKERAKERAEDRARSVMSARQMAGMYAKDFERVCKVWARSSEETPEELVEAFQMRLEQNLVPLVCMTVAFGEAPQVPVWQRIRRMLMEHFGSKPHDAVSMITMGEQLSFWTAPVWTFERSGPPHVPVVRIEASWEKVDIVRDVAGSKKRAEQEVAVLLVAKRAGMDPPQFVADAAPTPLATTTTTPTPPKKAFVFDMTKDPISLLMEYCQAHSMAPPEFVFDQKGPAHTPTITCTATCAGKHSTARSSSKQDAKRSAAIALIAQVRSA